MSVNVWPEWIKVKYVILVIIYFGLLIITLLNQSFTHGYLARKDKYDSSASETKISFLFGGLFYVGYILGNLPGGIIADLHGGRHTIGCGVLMCSITSFVYPYIVDRSPWLVTAVMEFVIGISEGLILPSAYSVLARWLPASQMTFLLGTLDTSFYIGRIIVFYTVIYVPSTESAWMLIIFQIWGGFAALLYCGVLIFVYSTPWSCKMSTHRERAAMEFVGSKRPKRINWKRMLRDEAVWAITLQHFSHKCVFYVMSGELSALFSEQKEQILVHMSTMLWLAMLSSWISTATVNHLMNEKKIPGVYLRGICVALGNCFCNFILLIKSHTDASVSTDQILRSLAFLFKGIQYAGGQTNVLDLTRFYSGTIIGIQNALSGVVGYLFQLIYTTTKAKHGKNSVKWERSYDLSFCICVITSLLYFLWARAERADWDVIIEDDDEDEDEEEYVY